MNALAANNAHADRSSLSRLSNLSCVVAIPVRDERDRIVACLDALAGQVDVPAGSLGILVFLNNCTDDTRAVVEQWLSRSPSTLRILEQDDVSATAGWARRQAMDAAADWLSGSSGDLLLTTDADSRVPLDWVARNRAAIVAGADAVAGRFAFDPIEVAALPPGLRLRQELEATYESLLAEIEARLAPRPGNPWPCHRTTSGASIAVRLAAYRAVGGIPSLSSGEDRAFIERVAGHGLVVRHAADIVVTTSGRLDGRARGGTADTLRRWFQDPEAPCEPRLQRLDGFVWRVLMRRFRAGRRSGRPLRPRDLPSQIGRARLVLRLLRVREGYRGDRPLAAPLTRDMPKGLSTT